MQIKEYKDFNIDEIKNLYDAVGWRFILIIWIT